MDFVYGAQAILKLMKIPIEILIYTDDPTRVDEERSMGIRELRRHINAHQPAFAEIHITLVSRNSDANHHADHLLHHELAKKNYDQVWFFGIHQINKEPFMLGIPGGGGPRSELEAAERDDLALRMSVDADERATGIGILITGDHANPPPHIIPPSGPGQLCPPNVDHRTFIGLGRALGTHVIRGGELRDWEGPPTNCADDSNNTNYLPGGGDLSQAQLQHDANPQPLILPTFDIRGNPSRLGEPHKLFMGKNGTWIRVLPDHQHEGFVVLPKSFPATKWPNGPNFQPLPRIIAYGTDRRTGKRLNILGAYDGDPAKVGRIVSDSSFHHYMNINLKELSAGSASAEADQIGQFYSNLAVWLSPRKKRREMGVEMIHWLANEPLMVQYVGTGPISIGRFAVSLALEVATSCEIQEILIAMCPDRLRQSIENFIFKPPHEASSLPSLELLFGSILEEYFIDGVQREDAQSADRDLTAVLQRGFEKAFLYNCSTAIDLAYESLCLLLPLLGQSLAFNVPLALHVLKSISIHQQIAAERSTMMNGNAESWVFDLTLDKNGETESFTLNLNMDPADCQEFAGIRLCRLTGELIDGMRPWPVVGTRLFTGPGYVITLEFAFRRVRILATGVETREGFTTRFLAFRRNQAFTGEEEMREARIDPDTGDTGTGTATQTLLSE